MLTIRPEQFEVLSADAYTRFVRRLRVALTDLLPEDCRQLLESYEPQPEPPPAADNADPVATDVAAADNAAQAANAKTQTGQTPQASAPEGDEDDEDDDWPEEWGPAEDEQAAQRPTTPPPPPFKPADRLDAFVHDVLTIADAAEIDEDPDQAALACLLATLERIEPEHPKLFPFVEEALAREDPGHLRLAIIEDRLEDMGADAQDLAEVLAAMRNIRSRF
jgi:hypothetical protein